MVEQVEASLEDANNGDVAVVIGNADAKCILTIGKHLEMVVRGNNDVGLQKVMEMEVRDQRVADVNGVINGEL
jgi:hypothetical protein